MAGEFYRATVSGLCESTTYEFSAWLINLVIAGSFCSTQPGGTIPINVSFEIWDSTDSSLLASGDTGDIFETSTPNWEEYALVFQTLAGQDTVILKMINNGQGGCGNDLAIDDIEFKTCGDGITIADSNMNAGVDLCLNGTTFSTTLTVTPDNSVFTNHFYQWQESSDGILWNDITGETSDTLIITNLTSTTYYRAKVAESAVNLNNEDCNTFSDTYLANITVAPILPALECWETATFNSSICDWEISGNQPDEPTGLECWEIATFNDAICDWEITGTQPLEPTNLECWEVATFNDVICAWEITGTEPLEPTDLECWETATFNESICDWEITGTAPVEPTDLECWETAIFNDAICTWEITGTEPLEPTDLECWETASFNETSCAWEITGTEPLDFIEESVSFCEGESIFISGNIGIQNPIYLWDTGETTEEIEVALGGVYTVEITSELCFTTVKTITVIENQVPVIESVISQGNDIVITTSNEGNFEYSLDGITFQSSNIFANVVGGYYTIYVRDTTGCGQDSTQHLHFIIPLFVTPNGDGYNDTFDLRGIEYFTSSEVFIFNRYGKLIKSGKNSPFQWDGTFNNQELPSSDYWYYIKIEDQVFRGHFAIKR